MEDFIDFMFDVCFNLKLFYSKQKLRQYFKFEISKVFVTSQNKGFLFLKQLLCLMDQLPFSSTHHKETFGRGEGG